MKTSLRDALRVYRGGAAPAQPPPVIPGRVVTPAPARDLRRALTVAAAVLLPALLIGAVVYAARTSPPPAVTATPSPVVVERVVEVTAAPGVGIVTATPANSGQWSVVRGQPQPQPTPAQAAPAVPVAPAQRAAPMAQPKPAPVQRPAASQPAPTPVGPQERLLSRPCVYPSAPQGTVIQGYYTDAGGVKRDAVCRPDGWKAVDVVDKGE